MELKHVRGYLERDLRPESMWTKSTSRGSTVSAPQSTEVSSSSGAVAADNTPPVDQTAADTTDHLRMSDIENNVEFFLGPPGPFLYVLPKARPYSKARSLPNADEYIRPTPRVIAPPPKAASSASGGGGHWVQKF